jgi:hypothetical protein
LALNEPPEGVTIQSVSPVREGAAIQVKTDADAAKPGLKGNLIVDAFVERSVRRGPGNSQGPKRRIPVGTLPAIPFEVVESQNVSGSESPAPVQ